jgi:tetratricopeptide (TPR) repeat protein
MTAEVEELVASGFEARRRRSPSEALRQFEAAATVARARADSAGLAAALEGQGQVERDLGHTGPALARYESAVALLRTVAAPLRLAHAMRHVADILVEHGEIAAARPHYEEALAIYRADPSTPDLDLANALRGFAIARERAGLPGPAAALWREARELYIAAGVPAGSDEAARRLAYLAP